MKTYHSDFFDLVDQAGLATLSTRRRYGHITSCVVVELGTRMGLWAREVLKRCAWAHVYCIDPWPRREKRGLGDTFPRWFENLEPWAFSRAFPIRGTSQEWARVWPASMRPCMVFVDGDHHEAAVLADGILWWNLLLPGGMIAFHDTNEPEVLAGMLAFLETLDNPPEPVSHCFGPGKITTHILWKE